ncbi:MAG: hypothetical protein SOT60_00130, partial [Bilifractor sp.]|nr:hypothetical protein [Bilifractor sp.]
IRLLVIVKVAKTVKNLPTFGSFRKVRYYLIIPKSGDGHQCTDYLPLTFDRTCTISFAIEKGWRCTALIKRARQSPQRLPALLEITDSLNDYRFSQRLLILSIVADSLNS